MSFHKGSLLISFKLEYIPNILPLPPPGSALLAWTYFLTNFHIYFIFDKIDDLKKKSQGYTFQFSSIFPIQIQSRVLRKLKNYYGNLKIHRPYIWV